MTGRTVMTEHSFEIRVNNSNVYKALTEDFGTGLSPQISVVRHVDAAGPACGVEFKCEDSFLFELQELVIEIDEYLDANFGAELERGEIDVGIIQ